MSRSVQVTPRHRIALGEDYERMLDKPPREDFVVRTLARRKAGEMTLMMGELVIAGEGTRNLFDRAAKYPVHFRKTYYPGKLHGDPRIEFERHELASTLIPVPAPIGSTPNTFRSCFLPGTPLDRLSGLGTEPDESNIRTAQELSLAAAAGLWTLTETALAHLTTLQTAGLTHGDTHLHNWVVCPSPLELLPIDFEVASLKEQLPPEEWERRCDADRSHLLKFAIYLMCGLGRQRGPLADASMSAIDRLVSPVEAFQRAIDERTFDTMS